MANMVMSIEPELRLCEVNNVTAYFHCWEHNSCNGKSQVYGIVETTIGMRRVDPEKIYFVDEKHDMLYEINARRKCDGAKEATDMIRRAKDGHD